LGRTRLNLPSFGTSRRDWFRMRVVRWAGRARCGVLGAMRRFERAHRGNERALRAGRAAPTLAGAQARVLRWREVSTQSEAPMAQTRRQSTKPAQPKAKAAAKPSKASSTPSPDALRS